MPTHINIQQNKVLSEHLIIYKIKYLKKLSINFNYKTYNKTVHPFYRLFDLLHIHTAHSSLALFSVSKRKVFIFISFYTISFFLDDSRQQMKNVLVNRPYFIKPIYRSSREDQLQQAIYLL